MNEGGYLVEVAGLLILTIIVVVSVLAIYYSFKYSFKLIKRKEA